MTQDMTETILSELQSMKSMLRHAVMLILLMAAGISEAWGQDPKVPDGVYYIKNNNSGNWYLWPAITVTKNGNNYSYAYNYLTTHDGTTAVAVNQNNVVYPAHDNTYPHWVVKNVDGKIQLINPKLNKYVVIQKHTYSSGKDVALSNLPTGNDVDYSYFVLNNNASPYKISPYPSTHVANGKTTANYSLNSKRGADRTWLTWSEPDHSDRPQLGENDIRGLIQFYDGGTPLWSFTQDLLAAPTISDVDDNSQVTVTETNGLPSGYNIRYTTDGTDPTATSDIMPAGGYEITTSATLKVVIERYGVVLTGIASKAVEPRVKIPSGTINAGGTLSFSSATGTNLYYTTDGTDPTTSSTPYNGTPISDAAIASAMGMAIKVIAVDNSDNTRVSSILSMPLANYTYHIVNKAGNVAIQHTIKQAVGKPLGGYTDIPAVIRSPYVDGEEIKFYNHADCADEHQVTATPATTDIYVSYTTDHLMQKFIHLRGARPLNVTVNGDYIYDTGGAFAHKASPTDDEKASSPYLWFFSGEDPYAIEIKNAATNNYLGFTTPSTLVLGTSPANRKYILMSGNAASDGSTYEQMELMAATGDGNYYRVGRTGDAFSISTTATGDASLQVRAYPNNSAVTYHLIDKAGKILTSISNTSEDVSLPNEWRSPLVSEYKYWKASAFTINGDIYTLKATPAEDDKINTIVDATDGNIYVTYTVNNDVIFDTTDDGKTGATYRLQFINGENFLQENGKDGVMTTAQKGVYPYCNGDGMLFVYGDEQWTTQLNSGASTRSRWLWYIVSANSDPYHVKILSYQLNSKPINESHSYFRTFPVTYRDRQTSTDVTRVVTSLTTKEDAAASAPPTEYMVLTGQGGQCKLVTIIDDVRYTANSFEQYWKNNPTVQNKLGNAKVTDQESYSENIILTSAQESQLPNYWHTYQTLVNSAPWVEWKTDGTGTGRQYKNKNHWFQTVNMSATDGADGEFKFIETTLQPQVILIDNHGWEIMRKPMYDKDGNVNAELKLYDSPMVETYHWYPKSTKIDGYHKYTVADGDEQITIYNQNAAGKWVDSGEKTTHTSTSLFDIPYDHITPAQDKSVKTDFYVTYDVKTEYARLYSGAATAGETSASAFLVKQGDKYAKINGSNQLETADVDLAHLDNITSDLQWYVKPNFNIDAEMGYVYEGENGEKNQADTETDNFNEGRNGFDPYNVQIQSVANTYYYFKTSTTDSHLDGGIWKGTSTDLSLKNMSAGTQTNIEGYDQTNLTITNATFMVVKDADGHMLLMPRFDQTKVVNSFTAPRLSNTGDATQYLILTLTPKIVHSSNDLSALGGQYVLASDFTFESGFESLGTSENPFTGSIDGGGNIINSNLGVPLLAYANGAVVKNLILNNVSISGGTNAGAIAANALGDTRIYNCGILNGSVGGSGDVGGLVGQLDDNARVINCYSYATITGGTNVGGIVGNNKVATTAAMIGEGNGTMVMNCMFYGDITGGTTVSPVYGGNNINNSHGGLNTYNYYAYDELKSKAISSGKYNCALAVEEKYLTRFEFYRQLLNSNKKLAAYYASSPSATVNAEEMMKWVLETADRTIATPKPYPVLKPQGYYPSIINYDTRNLENYTEENRNKGLKTGTLSVTISGVGSNAPAGAEITNGSLTLTRTDKDFDRFNFNYDKVQLPYYNDVGTKNYTGNRVVTGWKITSMSGGTAGTYTEADNFGGYNFADRNCTAKDIYDNSHRVFSQGAYFDVPYGVTAITIEPYWGTAVYVADERLDVVYNTSYGLQSVSNLPKTFSNGKITIDNSEQTVYTSINGTALGQLTGSTVYDNAIVLVGNLHQNTVPSSDGGKKFTIMSIDLDNDHEPDYSMIYHHSDRLMVSPIRFDFLNVPGTAQAQKPNGTSTLSNVSIFRTKGWFEITNTTLIYFSQFEYENKGQSNNSGGVMSDMQSKPLILLGGVFDQFVSTQIASVDGKTKYIHVGSNVWFHEFGLGTHSDGSQSTPHPPVSVTGGDYDGFYLTGTYNQDAGVRNDNAECYISGGHFVEAAGASQEAINGDVHWQIYDADIENFFGGGINAAKPIKGNVRTDIYNSHVDIFCGGPKFGDMQANKTVTTNAEGCTFTKFFGGGYGGTSYSKKKYYDKEATNWTSWSNLYNNNDRGKYFDGKTTDAVSASYGKKGIGVAVDVDYEFFVWSKGNTGGRFFVKFASFTLATCNNVTSSLKSCHVKENFYGGGSLGKVAGKATSVLDGCTVNGNVFGGGYSATLPKVLVRNAPCFTTAPNFNTSSGMFEPATLSGTTVYEWKHIDEMPANGTAGTVTIEGKNYLYTDMDLTALGQVNETDLTIKGNTTVEGKIFDENGDVLETTGGVFGGGDESAVNSDTKVNIQKNENNATPTVNNVFGGGNTADVLGNAEVNMTSGTISHDVYGGGKGQTTTVDGNVTVNIGAKAEGTGALSGNGTVTGSVYGGSALGTVNAATVNIYGGSVGNVFGGGLGQVAVVEPATPAIAAQNLENATVNVEGGTVRTAVYGGANINGVLKNDATVTIIGGTIGNSGAPDEDVIFGGGKGEPTLVNGNVTVNIGTEGQNIASGAMIYGHVYGGSALGNTSASKTGSDPMEFNTNKTTNVNLYAGTINGYAFGGGLGRKAAAAVGTEGQEGYIAPVTAVESFVGGDVNVLLDGAKVQQIFGCNNLNGTPKGHVKVHVKRTNNFTGNNDYKNDNTTALEARTTYDVTAVYGGGNQADYNPTKATGTEKEKKEAFAEVLIEGCDKTSIEYVYGGGNAAAVPADSITVKSAYIIGQLFGGGNGAGDGNPGADVGVIDKTAYEANNENGIYGTGLAKTVLIGGQIRYVYGGSNTKGNVRGGTSLKRNEANTCTLKIHEIYGAGQLAPMDGDVNITLECMPEEFVSQVFGGAKNATINGNVSLTVTSGKFGRVFGGNNEGGSINGSITVNVYEDGCLPLIIGELYGGGNQAPYSIYGCTQNGNDWTANTSGDLHFDQEAQGRSAVEVNVYSCTSIGKVFGGGYGSTAHVVGNTHVYLNMMKGIVNGVTQDNIGKIGQVFGGGNQGIVKGSTLIDIGTALANEPNGVKIESGDDYLSATSNTNTSITAGVYGGGNEADVDGNATLNIGTQNLLLGVNIASNIFGGGLGENTHVTGDVVMNIGKRTIVNQEGPVYAYDGYANITGDVYGGSAKGKVNSYLNNSVETASEGKTTQVNFYGGIISGNLYGGGLGEDNEGTENDHAADVYGPVTVNVEGGSVTNVFGCNNVLGSPKSTATVNIHGTPTPEAPATYIIQNVYGGGNMAAYTGTGGVSVLMSNGYVNDVFGGGLGTTATVNSTTAVMLTGGKVTNDVYGGGSQGSVTGAVNVTLNGGTVTQNIYGGGLGDLASLGEGHADVAANVGGAVTVSVMSGSANNVFGCNNVNGMPTSTVDVVIGTKTGEAPNITYSGTGVISGNVYGGGNMAACTSSPSVKIYGGTVNNNVYGGGLGATAATSGSAVIMEGGLVKNDVYGGGSLADVTGSVSVRISGGTVTNDVYGGGALANTNTDNWDTPGSATTYVAVTDLNTREYYAVISIAVGQSVEGYFKFNGSTYVAATGTAVKGETYYQRLSSAPIAGYYTKSGDVYTLQTSGNAENETTYYKKVVVGSWAEGKNNNETGTVNKTTVILTGGSVGNVYGGGLGSSTVAANVYGDVKVTVNKPEELTSTGGTGIAFSYKSERVTFGEGDKRKEYIIPTTGRVFGCNNINGTPTGNVRVEVYSTRQADENGVLISNSEHSPNSNNNRYEIQGVYGGGNLSDYLPADGKATSVYIGECDVTSIEKVYGGGNSASVPTSNVTINGSFDLGYAFGGGNGGDLIKKDGVWYENAGAIVISQAYIAPIGGKIGAVFGGSDAKGNCGSIVIDKSQTNPNCPLRLLRLYGAGNEADVDNVNIIISGCSGGENAEIEYVYGGSYNANVANDVNLTITAGKFKNIYGGNDRTGSIGGNIIVNIEETDNCMPITIQNLLGGGYQAPYPGTKRDGTEITTPGRITVNVKSATRIDNIYGGSFKADVNGDTEVNINMTKGYWAGKTYGSAIADSVGTIGNIYGGGNQGVVRGNSTVNIATATTVGYVTEPTHLRTDPAVAIAKGEGDLYYVPVTGARITGDVFGGGNEANVNGNATVNICTADYSGVTGFEGVSISHGSVFGGGNAADVLGNTNVTMNGGYVFNGIFGGGYAGSVGTFTRRFEDEDVNVYGHTAHAGCIGKPVSCAENTGKCTVVVNGGQIGPITVATQGMNRPAAEGGPVPQGWVWGGSQGLVQDPEEHPDTHFSSYVGSTDVTIGGTALIMESIIGGGEFGRVLGNTLVKIEGGQIGIGEGKIDGNNQPIRYTDDQFVDPLNTEITAGNALTECSHFPYGRDTNSDGKPDEFLPYDPYYEEYPAYIAAHPEFGHASTSNPTDGKTWIGCVFGGGSGYMPYKKKDGSGYDWCRSAGLVEGNTEVRISGGHILTNVYGANEVTDVKGQSIIRMTGGTIGVPRTEEQIAQHPLTCYLFGGGKGDERSRFFDFNDVGSVDIDISGGIIYGSVFGGSEDGHVLGNINLKIRKGEDYTIGSTTYTNGPIIGTWGTTYVEGNVFGGGRGFSGETLTAGSTGGNVTMSIEGGTMRGSVYGGGRLASVGIGLNPPDHLFYGQLKDETGGNSDPTYGHVTINISGGTIGNGTTEAGAGHPVSGNVFGGSMGRITMLDGKTRIPLWPKQAVTKLSNITISGGEIWNSVYGGGEIGIVRNHATVNVSGGTIHGNVFGGGYGSDEQDKKTISAGGYDDIPTVYYTFTPMIWTGCVSGDTEVNISGGSIMKNVYGGGNFASVGLMNFNSNEDGTTYNYITKHDTSNGFGLSWPYEFQYIKAAPTDGAPGGNAIGGKTTVNITGGRIGTTANAGYGNVFGGSKGMVTFKKEDNETLITDVNEQRYTEAFCANVRETEVNINYSNPPESDNGTTTECIVGAVYGGAQDGHVYEDANVTITKGLIGLSVYGGGQGESTFQGKLRNQSTGEWKDATEPVQSITAGKVYGNTSVSMTGGTVIGHVYGGGNLASVGKGNYAGGADDYYPAGYGEKLTGNLWASASEGDNAWHFLNSGNTTVTITGGKVGTLNGTSGHVFGTSDVTPTGMVFGGSRGRAAQDVMLDPRHEYAPDFYLGYVNNATVTIGDAEGGPRIYSQVFGGGRDGHVRGSAHVIVNNGIIGQTYAETANDYQRYHRGNVYGAGSGLGVYDGTHHGISSGSVTNSTTVDINGGTIYNNVYGGGALACVGPPRLDPEKDYAAASISKCTVNINGGTIGEEDVYNTHKFGGTIYGGSRGDRGGNYNDLAEGESIENYASVLWTEVNINPHPTDRSKDAVIAGNVYGGARGGQVKKDTKVNLLGGVIKHNAYGGGRGTTDIAADVLGNTTVELNKGVAIDAKGCSVDKVFGCNDLNGTPKGHVLVHVYGTQNSGTANMQTKVGPGSRTSLDKDESEGYIAYLNRLINLAKDGDVVKTGITASVITEAQATITGKVEGSLNDDDKTAISNAATSVIAELQKLHGYDVTAVYGGGDLAPYDPTVAEDNTEVIIEGCDVTSIKQVYGGGNAAFAPATNVLVKSAYVIDELFGGGNGHDNYVKDGKWYENPGANVGYKQLAHYDTNDSHGDGLSEETKYAAIVNTEPDATTKEGRIANYSIGLGTASTVVNGGHIHHVYGGSNEKGNIRAEALLQIEQAGSCTLITDEVYAGSKTASIDAETNTVLDCVRDGGTIYGGSYNADILNDVHIRITNGHYAKVFGGNNKAGTITGSITIDVEEHGCTPIVIDELYAGGYLAPYSVYGYSTDTRDAKDENGNAIHQDDDPSKPIIQQRIPYKKGDTGALATPSRDPQINIISATKIGKIYGGGYMADLIGSPHINVNMTTGRIREAYASEYPKEGYTYITQADAEGNKIIPVGTIGTIFGGGNKGDIYGDTYVEIGTGKHHTFAGEEETITPARNAAYIMRESTGGQVFGGGDQGYVFGNTNVIIGNGYIYDRVYGGGNDGTVGTVSTRAALPAGHASHANCLEGKPTAFAENTGRTTVTVSGGYVGPYTYERSASTGVATPTPMTMPQDFGYVFGAGRGKMANPHTSGNEDIEFMTYVDSTRVTISGNALIAGGVYGGSENGRVLHNTGVYIEGGQIGLGAGRTTAYADEDFIDPTTATAEQITTKANAMPECAHWAYESPWLPYDEHANNVNYQTETYGAASTTGYDGHTFYGNVFGGGSGYFAYETTTEGVYEWLSSAGLVEGDTYVNISGGHILTNVYGGNEMTNITGTAHVTMTGGTLGVPRTLTQIAAHPVTCYLFGAGKGDERVHFNKSTNVGHVKMNVSGGIIYGSIFGGGEDGHVLGNVDMKISDGAKIGTWGTSYVDGNVFGGGRGFSGDAYTAGNVAGCVTLNITGGTMLGSVYGGGRLGSVGYGLFGKNEAGYGTMRDDGVTEDGFTPPGGLTKGRGHVTVNISGDNTVIGNKYEYQYISPETTGDALAMAKTYLPSTQFESNNRLKHTRGGNVFAGGMGRYTQLDGTTPISTYDGSGNLTSPIEWKKLGNVKSTKLTISGNPWIMGNVYGGGEYGAVQGYHQRYNGETPMVDAQSNPIVASTEIIFSGGTIGTEITTTDPAKETIETSAARSIVQYTFGSIYGGGMGQETHDATDNHGGDVKGSTYVSISGENTKVRASVFGGGEMAAVDGNTNVTISGGEIGRNEVKPADDADAGYVLFGSATMGNVYGGGKGVLEHTKAGLVKGNTNVNISGGSVYHNVYGGGALASVGTFDLSNGTDTPDYIPIAGVPYNWADNTGTATVTITGGTIGISGRDNGLVFGSSRGDLSKPTGTPAVDPYDRVAWVNKSVVTIGTNGSGTTLNTPLVKGSVYGGGENGHNDESATVNVYSGTIGVTDTADPWYYFTDKTLEKSVQLFRGNVYGAGSGSDTYTGDDSQQHYNPKSGMVGGNTIVNIAGGHVGRSVYGGGAMASVGTITSETKHESIENGFGLSWPYKFEFAANTGKATVNVTGGHIGTRQLDGGDVYGSSRGEAGDRYDMSNLAFTNETEVNVNYPTTIDMPTEADIQNDFSKQCITGSVHGSGENGYVYGDTKVTLSNGLIGHSLYGAGKGNGTYTKALNKLKGGGTYDAKIYSLIAGKVMGNTSVTMNGGRVGRNVYGGGNMGSVGKGNYTSGADDYFPAGYGETITGNLWDNVSDDSKAFLSSGKATVNVISGTVGYIDATNPEVSMKNQLPYGNVIGGSAGEAAPNIAEDPRYEYSPAFFSGYVNETDVTIGGYRCTTAYGDYHVGDFITAETFKSVAAGDSGNWEIVGPKIYASVYGGGQDGHVRRDTKVTVIGGEIGLPYNSTNQTLLQTDNLDSPQWMHRGNIYGGGSGITKYRYDFNYDGDTADNDGSVSYNDQPVKEEDYSSSSGSVTRFTEVNVMGGTIHRNVYGGGSMGSVGAPRITQDYDPYKKNLNDAATLGKQSQNTINIGGGTSVVTIGTPTNYNKVYGGDVYGACRGQADLNENEFATSVWTQINIKDKAKIMGNVFGGGDSGIVKKDTDIEIGAE